MWVRRKLCCTEKVSWMVAKLWNPRKLSPTKASGYNMVQEERVSRPCYQVALPGGWGVIVSCPGQHWTTTSISLCRAVSDSPSVASDSLTPAHIKSISILWDFTVSNVWNHEPTTHEYEVQIIVHLQAAITLSEWPRESMRQRGMSPVAASNTATDNSARNMWPPVKHSLVPLTNQCCFGEKWQTQCTKFAMGNKVPYVFHG